MEGLENSSSHWSVAARVQRDEICKRMLAAGRHLQRAKPMSWPENELLRLPVVRGSRLASAVTITATEMPHDWWQPAAWGVHLCPAQYFTRRQHRGSCCPGSPWEILKAWQKSKGDFSFFCQRRRKKWASLHFVGLWKISGVSLLRSAPLCELECMEEFNQKNPWN